MDSAMPPTQAGSYCPACGHFNPSNLSTCEQCNISLVIPAPTEVKREINRPGCVTVYALLMGLSGILAILMFFIMGFSRSPVLFLGIIAGVLYLLFARGLWQMKNWARIVTIVLYSFGILINLIAGCTALMSDSGNSSQGMIEIVVAVIVGGIFIYWFSTHRAEFI